MLKTLFCTLAACIVSVLASAQGIGIIDGMPMDSTILRFNNNTIPGYTADTATVPLWQIGRTHKTFFTSDTAGVVGIMTDTGTFYPANADNYFIIRFPRTLNPIIDFWHRFQTDSFHAGGIVEFSYDHGTTWQNVRGDCNTDSAFTLQPGIRTENMYGSADTLFNGQYAFMGSSSTIYSRMQFFYAIPLKTTSPTYCYLVPDSIYIRFHFVSDTTSDTLAGWMIDSLKIETDRYLGDVASVNADHSLKVYPNPSVDGVFYFPALTNGGQLNIEVYSLNGTRIIRAPYQHTISLEGMPPGSYFYRVYNGSGNDYYGHIQKE